MLPQRIIDHLRNQSVTEDELHKIYGDFGRGEYERGYNHGAECVRGILRKQKACRQNNLQVKCNKFLSLLEDHLNEDD